MKALFALLLAFCPTLAVAQVVVVQSGAHEGFSRLVIETPNLTDWQLHRTEVGYALQLPGAAGFDVSKVYDRVGTERLSALWVDPETGLLQLRIGCDCHALPYELRAGVLVLDIRDGPAPKGSSFELSAQGAPLPPFATADPARPRARPLGKSTPPAWDWVDQALSDSAPMPGWELAPLSQDMSALRDGLFRALGSGAARGVVTLDLPPPKPVASDSPAPNQIRIGQDLGMITLPGGQEAAGDNLSLDGQTCPSADQLDLGAWGSDAPVAQALVESRQGLFGEFDRPDAAAVDRAVRYHLHLGFGAEARQFLALGQAQDTFLLTALSHLVDGQPDPAGFFQAFARCETPAALWAAVSAPQIKELPDLNNGAVIRAFTGLPPHLRRALGPELAGKYLDAGQTEQSRLITAAILRGVSVADASTQLAVAHVELASGENPAAAQVVENLAQQNAPVSPQAMIDLVALRLGEGRGLQPAQIDLLAALVQEHRESKLGLNLRRALALAHATAGQFDAAFAEARLLREDLPDLWRLLAEQGPDADLLIHAVLDQSTAPPEISWSLRRKLALRLQVIGLPEPALRWLEPSALADPAPEETRRLRAQLLNDRFDYAATLQILSGVQDPLAAPLRAGALLQTDQAEAAALQFAAIGDAQGLAAARRQSGAWTALPPTEGPWANAADLANLPQPEMAGPLAKGQALLTESSAARGQIEALLALGQ